MNISRVVVKIGGRAAANRAALDDLAREIHRLVAKCAVILVHGGGAEVSRVSRIFGIEPVFVDGKRVTTPAEMEIVDMVLSGLLNQSLVRILAANGVKAVGVSGSDGGLFTGRPVGDGATNRTGEVTAADSRLVDALVNSGYVPVVATTSMDAAGGPLNINADDAADALARAMMADALVYISDIPGVLDNGQVMPRLDAPTAEAAISAGVISGGMIPKVRGALAAVAAGVSAVVIGEYHKGGDLEGLLDGRVGTRLEGTGK